MLYLEDHQLVDAAFLEMVNSLLSAGEVSGLYSAQELVCTDELLVMICLVLGYPVRTIFIL